MSARWRPYDGEKDFLKIREFLIETFTLYDRPFNWLLDRWNFSRYFGIPYHTYTSYTGVPAYPRRERDELPVWEATIGIWEESGSIVGVVHTENQEPGEAWIQIHPEHTDLYDEMIVFIEQHLADRGHGLAYVKLYVNDNCSLEQVVADRGYRKLAGSQPFMELRLGNVATPELPDGFVVRSVADEDEVGKRCLIRAMAFGPRYAPSQWPPAAVFTEMQRAPDYRRDLDLLVVAPDGQYVAFCTIWLDLRNRYGNFEPVGTHAEYRGQGLARALLAEGLRRMAEHGIERSYMQSDNEFYRKVGFVQTPYSYTPWIRYFDA